MKLCQLFKMMNKTLIFILPFFFLQTNLFSQVINYTFLTDVVACTNDVNLQIESENTTGDTIIDGTITIDLSAFPGANYIGDLTQVSGPTITENPPGSSTFTFNDTLFNGETISFAFDLSTNCSSSGSSPEISGTFDYSTPSTTGSQSTLFNGFTVLEPDFSITASTPNNINGVIGFEFMVSNTVVNNGEAADSVYYCIADSPNADLLSIEVGGTTFGLDPNSPAGFSCFNIGSLANGESSVVIENWVITACDAPMPLERLVGYGCEGIINCSAATTADFPQTVLTLVEPTNPISIEITTDLSELSLCGPPATICVTIENNNGDDFVVRNNIFAMNLISGVEIDFSTLTTKTGDPVSLNATMDSIIIGDLEDGEISSFSMEISIQCGISDAAFPVEGVLVHDELCEGGVAMVAGELVGDITAQTAEFSIFDGMIVGNLRDENIFDAILGIEDTIKVPLGNAGSGGIDEFTYYVINTNEVANNGIVINGIPLTGTVSGDTTFYTITSTEIMAGASGTAPPLTNAGVGDGDGILEENEALFICEIWEGVECNFGTLDPIRRQAFFGCGGVTNCSESNFSTTGVDFGFAAPDLVYSEYDPLTDRPACYSDEPTTLAAIIVNEGNSIAEDITIAIFQNNWPGVLDANSLMASFDPSFTSPITGVLEDPLATNGNSCLSGPDLTRGGDAVFENINLMPGDTLYFTYQLQFG